jgi:hypothetical protein
MKEIFEKLTLFKSRIDEKSQKKLGINHLLNLAQKLQNKEDETSDAFF